MSVRGSGINAGGAGMGTLWVAAIVRRLETCATKDSASSPEPLRCHLAHLAAGLLAATARLRACLAGRDIAVLVAFGGAGGAEIGAEGANIAVEVRAARHEADALHATIRTV